MEHRSVLLKHTLQKDRVFGVSIANRYVLRDTLPKKEEREQPAGTHRVSCA